jgi:hypothetical protein
LIIVYILYGNKSFFSQEIEHQNGKKVENAKPKGGKLEGNSELLYQLGECAKIPLKNESCC